MVRYSGGENPFSHLKPSSEMQNPEAAPPDFPPANTSGPAPPATSNRSALLIVFLVVFIDLLGFGIVLPMLPRIADEYMSRLLPRDGNQESLSGLVIGLLFSTFSLMQFLFAPGWGRLSDRVGRRPILLIGLVGSVLFYALFGYASSLSPEGAALTALVLFFVARTGAGIAGATIATAQAVIADCTPPEKRKHGMALIGAAFGIGFTFGPLIGALAMWWFPDNHEAIGYSAALLSLIALVLGFRLLPETRRLEAVSQSKRKILDFSAIRAALTNPAIAPVILTFFLASLGFSAFEVTLSLLLKDAFHFPMENSFLIFAYVGFALLLTQGVFYRRLAKRVSEPTFMAFGIVFMGGGVGTLGAVALLGTQATVLQSMPAPEGLVNLPLIPLLILALTLAVVGFAFLTPSAQALVSRRTEANVQGEILGVNQSASALARILGPLLALPLYKSTQSHLLPYVFGSVLLLLMLPLIPRIRRG